MYNLEDLTYMVSLYCPGECVNCNIWQYEKNEITKDELELSFFESMLQSTYAKNIKYFDLTAGESQLSTKYVKVVKLIGKYFPNAMIHTNISGWYPKKHLEIITECLKFVKPQNFRIDISLDGDEENYKKVRLVKNGFSKVMQTIELLKPLGIKLRATMILYRENYQDIPWLVNFASKHKIDYFFGYARNANLLNNTINKYTYTKEELEKIESLLQSVNWLTPKREPNWLWAKSIYEDTIPIFNCYMGQKAIVMDPYGNIFPCNECLESLNMGNIKDFNGDLDKLLDSKQAKKVINKVIKKQCQPCDMLCAHKIEFPWGKQVGLQ